MGSFRKLVAGLVGPWGLTVGTGKVLLDASPAPEAAMPRLAPWLLSGALPLGAIVAFVDTPTRGLVVFLAVLVLSVVLARWRAGTVVQFRERALLCENSLLREDATDTYPYSWMLDARWEDDGWLVIRNRDDAPWGTPRFVRTRIDPAKQREAARILWERIGTSSPPRPGS